eukprot:scaffold1397_cov254-Pinguiococcus_pyrenoidosus.AAC.8
MYPTQIQHTPRPAEQRATAVKSIETPRPRPGRFFGAFRALSSTLSLLPRRLGASLPRSIAAVWRRAVASMRIQTGCQKAGAR